MRSLFFATCLAIGAGSMAIAAPARAEIRLDLPGVHIGDRDHHERGRDEWRRHDMDREHAREFRGDRNYGYNNGRPDWR